MTGLGLGLGLWRPHSGGAAAFSPLDLSPLVLWAGDDAGADVDTSGSPFLYNSIPNQGSLGGTVRQGDLTRRPEVITNFGKRLPNFPAASNDGLIGDGTNITAASLALLHDGTSNATLWARLRIDAAGTFKRLFDSKGGGAGVGLQVKTNGTPNWELEIGNGATSQTISSATAVTTGWQDLLYVKTADSVQLFVAATEAITPTTITTPTASSAVNAGVWGNYSAYNNPIGGPIGEAAIFPSALTADQRAALIAYGARWSA